MRQNDKEERTNGVKYGMDGTLLIVIFNQSDLLLIDRQRELEL
jgi:hypothetical protein